MLTCLVYQVNKHTIKNQRQSTRLSLDPCCIQEQWRMTCKVAMTETSCYDESLIRQELIESSEFKRWLCLSIRSILLWRLKWSVCCDDPLLAYVVALVKVGAHSFPKLAIKTIMSSALEKSWRVWRVRATQALDIAMQCCLFNANCVQPGIQ